MGGREDRRGDVKRSEREGLSGTCTIGCFDER
jgi:hypothetical protein